MRSHLNLSPLNLRKFWSKVDVGRGDECWVWKGCVSRDGYGVCGVAGQQWLASHVALVISGRPRPPAPKDHALHGDCSNRACVNPRHLRWGTNKENSDDRVRLKRNHPRKGEAHFNAKLNDEIVRLIRTSPETGCALADRLGVSKGTISLVRNRKVWAHLD